MRKFLMTSTLVALMGIGFANEPQPEEINASQPQKLASTKIVGYFEIDAPPSRELLQVLDAIQTTKENPNNSIGEWQASFLKNTKRIRDLVETGMISNASFKIDSSSQLVAADAQ